MLYASNVSTFAVLGILGRFSTQGCRAIIQRHGPEFSRHPVSTDLPQASLTIRAARVNVPVQSASQSGLTTIKVWQNPGIICPVMGNPDGSWGKFKSPVPVNCCDWPVAVPTLTFWAERSALTMGHLRQSRCPSLLSQLCF